MIEMFNPTCFMCCHSVNYPNKNHYKVKCPSPKLKFCFLFSHDDAVVGFPHPLAPGSAHACQLGEPDLWWWCHCQRSIICAKQTHNSDMKPLMVKSMTIMTTMMFVNYGGANWNDDAIANNREWWWWQQWRRLRFNLKCKQTDDNDDDGGCGAMVKDPSILQTSRSLCSSFTTSWGPTLTTMSLSQSAWLIYNRRRWWWTREWIHN